MLAIREGLAYGLGIPNGDTDMSNTTTQTAEYTVMHFPKHMRAGDAVARPVSILFTDEVLDTVAELKLSPASARELAAALIANADWTDAS